MKGRWALDDDEAGFVVVFRWLGREFRISVESVTAGRGGFGDLDEFGRPRPLGVEDTGDDYLLYDNCDGCGRVAPLSPDDGLCRDCRGFPSGSASRSRVFDSF